MVNKRQIVQTDDGPVVAQALTKEELREKAEMYNTKNLPKYMKKLHELAMGIVVQRISKGGPQIYAIAPDRAALEYLLNRGLGKTPDRTEIVGADGESVQMVIPWAPVVQIERTGDEDEVIEAKVTVLDEHPEVVDAADATLAEVKRANGGN